MVASRYPHDATTLQAFWTIHPTFSNNVAIIGNDVWTNGHGTDGLDVDSCWNVHIANNSFYTRDDCIALKVWSSLSWCSIDSANPYPKSYP